MNTATPEDNDDIPPEIDFSGGTRGKFHRPNIRLNIPVYLDADVQAYLSALAARKGVPLSDLANDRARHCSQVKVESAVFLCPLFCHL
jgi:hypothetical protein